jgi:hypothetical protein
MNANLNKYLSDVLRNEVNSEVASEAKEPSKPPGEGSIDRNINPINPFVVDRKYSLRLDEII